MHGAKTLIGYKVYRPGEIVMNRMQAWNGMFGMCELSGLVSPDYAVFQIAGDHHARFLLYRLKSADLVGRFAVESKAIGTGFNRLYTDRFGPIPITLPPPNEQAAVVAFLDHVNRRLDRAIRAKKRVITLLNEQKHTIMGNTVTRGLDPTARLKPSGIAWLQEIPQHWEIRPLKRLLSRMDYGTSENTGREGRVRVLTMGHIRDGEILLPERGSLDVVPQDCALKCFS